MWERAEDIKRTWEEAGTLSTEPAPAFQPETIDPHNGKMPLETAIAEFKIGYIEARKLNSATAYKYGIMLKQLQAFALALGFRYIDEFSLATLAGVKVLDVKWMGRQESKRRLPGHVALQQPRPTHL